ncbi:hypothetical protein L227DRAFT_213237 [Lentinus tigrinus ALCF2SS1-6]|uniref:Uncharacterized protein n=1 Tax=Lentinus tigrinus ALCF2SS1-6 TaxID=1328759 RepID=A0A5C2SQY2_9APHY|nr:hypothetical protein L227DRAFT_213237 [Lentinus tigrinus ALCF2SS1-6]
MYSIMSWPPPHIERTCYLRCAMISGFAFLLTSPFQSSNLPHPGAHVCKFAPPQWPTAPASVGFPTDTSRAPQRNKPFAIYGRACVAERPFPDATRTRSVFPRPEEGTTPPTWSLWISNVPFATTRGRRRELLTVTTVTVRARIEYSSAPATVLPVLILGPQVPTAGPSSRFVSTRSTTDRERARGQNHGVEN